MLATLAALVVGMMALAGTAWAVPDGIPPTVVGTVPTDGATDVALDAKIKVKFSERMKDRSINRNNIFITQVVDGMTMGFPAKVDYVDEKTPVRAVLKPLGLLHPDTTYTVVVAGANAPLGSVKDASGEALKETYHFSFTTA